MATPEYLVLLHGDEAVWREDAKDPEKKAAVYATHGRFVEACTAAGHEVVGGAELHESAEAIVVRRTDAGPSITEGPWTELVEQLGGYYVIRTADPHGLAALAADLIGPDGVVELRRQYLAGETS